MALVVIEMDGLDNNLHEQPQPMCDSDANPTRILISHSHSRANKRYDYEYSIKLFQTGCFNSLYKSYYDTG